LYAIVTGTGTQEVTTLSNPYKFYVYRNAAQNTAANAWQVIDYDTEVFDTGSNYSTSSYKFTAPVAGFYWFSAATSVTSTASSNSVTGLYKNGSFILGGPEGLTDAATGLAGSSVTGILQLNAGDTIQVEYFNSGSAEPISVGSAVTTWFQGFLLSST
jgi:C1q domain